MTRWTWSEKNVDGVIMAQDILGGSEENSEESEIE
jgi:hypothetical protein